VLASTFGIDLRGRGDHVIGETIGSYTILSQLGAGAMGEVYLAEHRHLKRKAAVKLLAREIVGRPDLLERFFLEARATSAIDHPGIVQVFDCEVDATGRPYIVMEYLDGETLAATLSRRGALPAATAARLGRGMAEALEAAHAKGIVHRDLKPENVFVQAHPPDSVKLVDFGIAKLAGDFRAGQVHQTRNGAMMGTPLYMSPEQCRDSGKIDFRTDLYSLGCVMFEMLTGHPPFTNDALGDLVVAHMTEQPKEASAVNPSVPKALSELTGELLRKDPAQRPANLRAVADRLAAFLGGLTTVPEAAPSAKPAAPAGKQKTTFGDSAAELMVDGEASERPARRAPLLLGVGAAIAVVAIGAVVLRRKPTPTAVPAVATAVASPAGAVVPAIPAAAPTKIDPHAWTTWQKDPQRAKHPAARRVAEAEPPSGPERHSNPAAARSGEAPAAADGEAPPVDFTGIWEGPWTDAARHQNGRLYLQIAGNGGASGWFSNAAVRQSFRLTGRMASPGDLALACACPPRQEFGAHVLVHAAGGELKGQLTLSGDSGVFGQSHLALRRAAAR
jgi:tRNA A-37 threonylcarbamoyl transferase component Bud32